MQHFSSLGGPGSDPNKTHVGTHRSELVFLHPLGSMGPIVRSGVSVVQNFDTLFFMLGWAQCGSQ
jgi:hypothetical protein